MRRCFNVVFLLDVWCVNYISRGFGPIYPKRDLGKQRRPISEAIYALMLSEYDMELGFLSLSEVSLNCHRHLARYSTHSHCSDRGLTLFMWRHTEIQLCWTVFLTERIPHAGVINSTEFFTFGQRWRIRFADLEFFTQTSLSHIRISIACTPVNKFLMNGNIFGEI